MTDRADRIRALLAGCPRDVFLHYSLAMELAASQQYHLAVDEFHACMELDSRYLPARVECAKALRSAGRLEEARRAFEEALAMAVELGERHSADYIRQQIEGLPQSS